MPPPRTLLVLLAVTDETAAALLALHVRRLGSTCEPVTLLSVEDNEARLRRADLVLLQLGPGAATCDQAKSLAARVPVVAVAVPEPELVFQAARAGVEALLSLPLNAEETARKLTEICGRMRRSAGEGEPRAALTVLPPRAARGALHASIPGQFATSEDMAEVRETIENVAPTSATVLLRGESGVGKELAARLVHSRSLRAHEAFIKVNCAAIPNELLESELFGYEAGAFTGALRAKPGKFELADRGTIFLDEIGEMHPMLQAKLLHVLQDGDFARLGSKHDVSVDVRVICATNQPLDILVREGRFREDLYYRVNVVTIHLPPLRARKREIPELMQYFLERYAKIYAKPVVPIDVDTMAHLMEHDWPGNIRELENLCKRYVIVGGATQIVRDIVARQKQRAAAGDTAGAARLLSVRAGSAEADHPDDATDGPSLIQIGKRAAWAAERAVIEETLRETRWNRREAARRLNVSYKALLNKIQVLSEEMEVSK